MLRLPVLLRLCWKEGARGWVMLAFGLLLPPLAAAVQSTHVPLLAQIPFLNALLLLAAVAVWASMLAAETREGTSFLAMHFPVRPSLPTGMTFLLQAGIALLIGLNIGHWPGKSGIISALPSPMLWGMLLILCAFGISFLVTLVFSPWSGIAASIAWGLFLTSSLLTFVSLPQAAFANIMQYYQPYFMYMSVSMLVAVLVLFMLMLIGRRVRTPKRQAMLPQRVLVCLLLSGTALVSMVIAYSNTQQQQQQQQQQNNHVKGWYRTEMLCSSDGSLAVEGVPANSDVRHNLLDKVTLHFVDFRTQRVAAQSFRKDVQPLAFIGRAAVILVLQQLNDNRVILLRWNLNANTTEPLGSIPGRSGALADMMGYHFGFSKFAVLSPDEGHLLFNMFSSYGRTVDLWCLDIPRRHLTLLEPAIDQQSACVGCRNDGAVFSEQHRLIHRAFTSTRETSSPLPALTEVRP